MTGGAGEKATGTHYCEPPLWWRMCGGGLPVSTIDTDDGNIIVTTGQSKVRIRLVQEITELVADSREPSRVVDAIWQVSWKSSTEEGDCSVLLTTLQLCSAFGLIDHIKKDDQPYLRDHLGASAGDCHRYVRTGDFLAFPGLVNDLSLIDPAFIRLNDMIRAAIQELCGSMPFRSDD